MAIIWNIFSQRKFAFILIQLAILISASTCRADSNEYNGKEYYSVFAGELNRTCAEGFSSKNASGREKKAYCMGFLYSVITKLEKDKVACFGADIGSAINEAAVLLPAAPPKSHVWQILEDGYKIKFPCS